jgi:molybdopterin-containing oxidoreductase family membrane subunit
MGTFGLFFTCYFLFSKFFPVIALAEIKHILRESERTSNRRWDKIESQPWMMLYEEVTHPSLKTI